MSPERRGKTRDGGRKARLAASLRENLKRRKTQQRSRAAEAQPTADGEMKPPASRDPKGEA